MNPLNASVLTLSPWIVGAAIVLLLALMVLAVYRVGVSGLIADLVPVGLVFVAVYIGWTWLDRRSQADAMHAVEQAAEAPVESGRNHDHPVGNIPNDKKRALDQRILGLTAQATAPGSSLGCLEAGLSKAVEGACESALFAGSGMVTSALAYVSAQLSLLADAINYVNEADPTYLAAVAGLRRSIETDRFGFVAQVLTTTDGCTIEQCSPLALLTDPTHVKSNIEKGTFNGLAAKYASGWARSGNGTTAEPSGRTSALPTSSVVTPLRLPRRPAQAKRANTFRTGNVVGRTLPNSLRTPLVTHQATVVRRLLTRVYEESLRRSALLSFGG
jgi:hypothetical protein